MANIKWSGIESRKYGLTANWYVSAYYGNDNDVDGVGLYNSSTNSIGHGGPTRPFATVDKADQNAVSNQVIVIDAGYYLFTGQIGRKYVGDGHVYLDMTNNTLGVKLFGVVGYNSSIGAASSNQWYIDCFMLYSNTAHYSGGLTQNSVFVECSIGGNYGYQEIENSTFINCSGLILKQNGRYTHLKNLAFINCGALGFTLTNGRQPGDFIDWCIVVNGIMYNGVSSSLQDIQNDGEFLVKSYDENDLFGHSPASVEDIKSIFCNYYSPIYIDSWQETNFHLKPAVHDIFKYGGLNGTFIGAKPVMHWFTSEELWDSHRDAGNTSDLEKDLVSGAIRITGAAESGTFRSVRISLPKAITANPAVFAANLGYNIEGTVKQGVSNQRIDTTPDMLPDNTANQRVVYDFKLATAPNSVDALSAFKNYELDREPTVDSQGRSHLDDNFDIGSETKQVIQDFMIEFTLRKVVIA